MTSVIAPSVVLSNIVTKALPESVHQTREHSEGRGFCHNACATRDKLEETLPARNARLASTSSGGVQRPVWTVKGTHSSQAWVQRVKVHVSDVGETQRRNKVV